MDVQNNTTFTVIALSWHKNHGYGNQVSIPPGESAKIPGVYVGIMEDKACYTVLPESTIVCHEEQDNENGFHVSRGNQCPLGDGISGITIRHHSEDLIVS